MVLLVASGLFARSLWRLRAIDTGFSAQHVTTLTVNLRLQGYRAERGRAFYRDLLDRSSLFRACGPPASRRRSR